MRPTAHSPTGGLYGPRNPHASPLYQCVARHHDELATANYTGIAQFVDACMQKPLRNHAAPDGEDRFPITSSPTVPDHG